MRVTAAGAPRTGLSASGGGIVLLANLVGPGMLTLPRMTAFLGIVGGVAMLLFMMCAAAAMAWLLSYMTNKAGATSYAQLASYALGRRGSMLVSLVLAVHCSGALIACMVLVSDFLQSLLDAGGASVSARSVLIPVIGACVLLPLSLPKRLTALKYAGALSFLCTVALTIILVVKAAMCGAACAASAPVQPVPSLSDSLFAVPVMMYVFSTHYAVPSIYVELRDRNLRTMTVSIALAFTSAAVIYISAAVSGYILFGPSLLGNVLQNFDSKDTVAIALRALLLLNVVANYLGCILPLRDALVTLVAAVQEARHVSTRRGSVLRILSSRALAIAPSPAPVPSATGQSKLVVDGATAARLEAWKSTPPRAIVRAVEAFEHTSRAGETELITAPSSPSTSRIYLLTEAERAADRVASPVAESKHAPVVICDEEAVEDIAPVCEEPAVPSDDDKDTVASEATVDQSGPSADPANPHSDDTQDEVKPGLHVHFLSASNLLAPVLAPASAAATTGSSSAAPSPSQWSAYWDLACHALLTAVLVAMSCVLGAVVTDLSVVLSYTGAIATSLVMFGMPVWMYMGIHRRATRGSPRPLCSDIFCSRPGHIMLAGTTMMLIVFLAGNAANFGMS